MITLDFHIHSIYSKDSLLNPTQIVKLAKKHYINVIAVTDHNSVKGAIMTKKIANNDVYVIIGSEIKTNYGEIIGLFLSEDIKSYDFFDAIQEIKDQNGFILLPHPLRNKKFDLIKENFSYIDLFEIYNGRNTDKQNQNAKEYALNNNIKTVAGSDAHFGFEFGKIKNIIDVDINYITDDDLKDLIMKNEIITEFKKTLFSLRFPSIILGHITKQIRSIG